jgi:hypothetical protein
MSPTRHRKKVIDFTSSRVRDLEVISSRTRGKNTETVEDTNISSHGIWLLTEDKELFMSYEEFPWFKNVTIAQLTNAESRGKGTFISRTRNLI